MSNVTIRTATAQDAANLAALSIQVWLTTYATEGLRHDFADYVLTEFSREKMVSLIADPGIIIRIAESEGHTIGYLQLTTNRRTHLHPSESQAEIDHLYVQEPFCRSGVGTALLNDIEEQLTERDIHHIWLSTWIGNTRAQAFYQKNAYEHHGLLDFVLGGESYENRVYGKGLRHKID